MRRHLLTVILLLSTLPAMAAVPVKDVTLLGLKLRTVNTNQVRTHFWRMGGFMEPEASARQINVDIFFPWSRNRELYRLEFHYDPNGRFQWAEARYRWQPHKAVLVHNRPTPLTTDEIARRLAEQLGEPKSVTLRQFANQRYRSYEWEDDTMQVRVDRLDGDPTQPVYVLYRLKTFNYVYEEQN